MHTLLARVLAALMVMGGAGAPAAQGEDEREIANLRAVAKAAGYARWFLPSDEGFEADWGRVIGAAVARCEGAGDGEELAARLGEAFATVAPGVRFVVGENIAGERAVPGDEQGEWVAWVHHGLGREDEGQSVYKSERVRVDPAGAAPMPQLRPGAMASRQLGRGITMMWPLSMEVREGRTVPAAADALEQPPEVVGAASGRSRRIADVIIAWNVLQHFYPYFDVVEVDWDRVLNESLERARAAGDDRELLDVLRWIVTQLEDGHGLVQHASDPVTHAAPLMWREIDGRLVVTHVGEWESVDAPDDDQWPRPGDVVLEIDGRPAMDVWAQRRELVSAATAGSREFKTGQALLLGGEGELALKLEGADGGLRTVRVARRPKQEGIREVEAWIPPREKFRDFGDGILYVDLDQASAQELHQMLPKLAAARGLVLDMRGYPRRALFVLIGHLIDEPAMMPRTALPVITLPDREALRWDEQTFMAQPRPPRLTGNVAILIDGRAVSAAEHFLGALEGAGVGTFVGERTAGTNGNINPIELPGGYRVVWTGLRVQKPDGSRHHGVGIAPDVEAIPTLAGVRAGRDEVLEKGLEVVRAGMR